MSDSVWPHGLQPTRLLRPLDSPGKNTGVGCHFLLQCMKMKSESEVAQLCPTLSDPILFFLYSYLSKLHWHAYEKAMAPHSNTLAWKIPWMEEPGRLQSMGSLRVRHDWMTSLSLSTFMHWRRKWQPTPVFLPRESHGQRSLVGCSPWGRKELDMTEQLHFHFRYMKTLGWMKHKLESRFLGEISVTSDMQMTPPLWQKAKKN